MRRAAPRWPGLPATVLSALAMLSGLAGLAHAGGRARTGGKVGLCLVAKSTEAEPLYADTPTDAAALLLTHTPLCQLARLSRPSPSVLRLDLPPTVAPELVVARLRGLQGASSPYRALLSGVGRVTEARGGVELLGAAPDAERGLCHPALAMPFGPFSGAGAELSAVPELPAGRPFLDGVTLSTSDARGAERLLAQGRVQLVLGSTRTDDAPQLFVLALVLPSSVESHLRHSLDATVDRADLVRFFLRPPASPMPGLLPPSLGGATATPELPPRPTPQRPPREVTLLYDESALDHRAIAERLQVKLQPLGYRVALRGVGRRALVNHRQAPDELLLVSVLVPPSPLGALLVMLELGRGRDRIPGLLAAVESSPDVDAKARELAGALLPLLGLWPLATRGLGMTQGKGLQHVTRDLLGLPRLEDAFLAPE